MDGMRVANATLVVYLHPSKANNIREATLRHLSSMLFRYDETFDAVALAYCNVQYPNNDANILPGISPFVGVLVNTKLLLFSPKRDMYLEGKVVKIGKESIHVIVLGFASAIITYEEVREEFRYVIRDKKAKVISVLHKRHGIRVGSMLRFLVKSVNEEMLHITGSLIPDDTGCIKWLSRNKPEIFQES